MRTKERELLERVISLIDYRYAPSEAVEVHREIKELLAQPEHSEKGLKENISQMAVEVYNEGFGDGIRFAEKGSR